MEEITQEKPDNGYLSMEQKVLLHLLQNNSLKDHNIVPDMITEQGICDTLGCTLGLISRILKENESNGFIYRTKSKFVLNRKRQNVFFLTENGLRIALEMKKIISDINNCNQNPRTSNE